jgi:hypothetical protein
MPNFTKSKGFQLRSGNIAKAPFKMMGSSPAKQSYGFSMTDDKTKDLKPKKVKTTKIDDSKTEKVKPQKLDIVNTGEATMFTGKGDKIGETNTSSRPGDNATPEQRMGSGFVTDKPKPEEVTDDTMVRDQPKEGKKSLWQKYKAYRDSDKFKENDAAIQDVAAMFDPTGRKKGGKEIRDRLDKKATIKKSDIFAKSEAEKQSSKETRDIEMHESKLAMNQSLTDKRNKVAQEDQENSLTTENETSLEPTVKFGVDWNKLSL